MISRLVWGLGLFFGSLTLGWWLHRRGTLTELRAATLTRFVVMGCSPIVLALSFWHMDLRRPAPWLLPGLGLVISCSTLLPAALYARRARLSPPQTGAFLTCALFSNLGYLGAFTAFALFGEAGYGLSMLYLVFFTPCFYTLGFAIASRYGRRKTSQGLGAAFNDALRVYPFLGMVAGAGLSLLRVPRPAALDGFNQLLIPASTALYLIAIGSQMTLRSPRPWLASCGAMSGIKFLYTPLIAWGLIHLLRIDGLPRQVILLESATPVAVSPLVLPLLFGLDRDLSNALWLFTTLVCLPVWLLLLPQLPQL